MLVNLLLENLFIKYKKYWQIYTLYSLGYLPAAGRLTVTIVKCDNLKSMDINGKSGMK